MNIVKYRQEIKKIAQAKRNLIDMAISDINARYAVFLNKKVRIRINGKEHVCFFGGFEIPSEGNQNGYFIFYKVKKDGTISKRHDPKAECHHGMDTEIEMEIIN